MRTKHRTAFCFAILMLLLYLLTQLPTFAEWPEFSGELTADQKQRRIREAELTKIRQEPKKESLKRIDVNEKGEILCVYEDPMFGITDTVCVYSDTGVFQYGFKWKSHGENGACWLGENILLFSVRSYALLIDRKGQIIDVLELAETTANDRYMSKPVKTEFMANGETYALRNRLALINILGTYSRIEKTTASGEKIIIYDASKSQETTILIFILAIVILAVFVAVQLIALFIALNKGRPWDKLKNFTASIKNE